MVSFISIPNSAVRSNTSGSAVSKPNTKLPQVEMPCSCSMSMISRYCEGRFWRLPVSWSVASSMLSKPMNSALQPLSAISRTFSMRLTAASEHCPIQCFFSGTMRAKSSAEYLRWIITLSSPNMMIHRKYSAELFARMVPLKKHWIGQCSLAAVRRIENVRLMAERGCKALFIGFESIDDATLQLTGKRQNRPSQYREIMDMLHEHGISTWGSFVFGFDTADPEVFERTAEFGIEMKLTMALYAILTPYPATRLYRRLKAEGRLTDEHWWLRGDHDA